MLLLDYELLWAQGGYAKDNVLNNALNYIKREATKRGIAKEIMDTAIMECFFKVSTGHPYSLVKCHCGCGIDKSGTDFVHSIVARMLELEDEKAKAYKTALEKQFNDLVIKHITTENKKYTDSQLNPGQFTKIGRGIAKGFKWFFLE